MEIMGKIIIVTIGDIDQDILKNISKELENIFHCNVELGKQIPIPQDCYNHRRKQYHSTRILEKINVIKAKSIDRVLGIIDADIYVPELNFVFGEADSFSGIAIISLTRLRQEFYGLHPDMKIFHERAVKEAIHEIGHTCSLGHCNNPKCIMYFSNNILVTDIKGPDFCNICREKISI
jgi:archaemetzincin